MLDLTTMIFVLWKRYERLVQHQFAAIITDLSLPFYKIPRRCNPLVLH